MRLSDDEIRRRLEPPSGEWRSEEGLRDAAVLALFVERGGCDSLVFTQRRDDLQHHAGQVSFPGGGREGGEDAVSCAIRETCEEIGVTPEDIEVLGRLPDRVSIAGFLVASFAARLDTTRDYVPLDVEVAEIFEMPLAGFLDRACWSFRTTDHPLARFKEVPVFKSSGRVVWGLTGIILRDLLHALEVTY